MFDERVARTAARWWSDAIRKLHFDNGAGDDLNMRVTDFAKMSAQELMPSAGMLGLFEDELVAVLREEVEKSGPRVNLYSDYGPGLLLATAAKRAGIPKSVFPWKTTMRIDFESGAIEARLGYTASYQTIQVTERTDDVPT